MQSYTFGNTRKTAGHLKSHGYRRETARAVRNRRVARASYDFHLKRAETLRFPYDLCTVLTRNIEESQNKKSFDAQMNCKHLRRRPLSPTMSKISQRKSQTEKSHNGRDKCNLVGMTPCGHPTIVVRFFVPKLSYRNREVTARSLQGLRTAPV